jgi:hypothetical protein
MVYRKQDVEQFAKNQGSHRRKPGRRPFAEMGIAA